MTAYSDKYQTHECGCTFVRRYTRHFNLEARVKELEEELRIAVGETEALKRKLDIAVVAINKAPHSGCHKGVAGPGRKGGNRPCDCWKQAAMAEMEK